MKDKQVQPRVKSTNKNFWSINGPGGKKDTETLQNKGKSQKDNGQCFTWVHFIYERILRNYSYYVGVL